VVYDRVAPGLESIAKRERADVLVLGVHDTVHPAAKGCPRHSSYPVLLLHVGAAV